MLCSYVSERQPSCFHFQLLRELGDPLAFCNFIKESCITSLVTSPRAPRERVGSGDETYGIPWCRASYKLQFNVMYRVAKTEVSHGLCMAIIPYLNLVSCPDPTLFSPGSARGLVTRLTSIVRVSPLCGEPLFKLNIRFSSQTSPSFISLCSLQINFILPKFYTQY